jgi:2-keto-3-deoxygluconate permease
MTGMTESIIFEIESRKLRATLRPSLRESVIKMIVSLSMTNKAQETYVVQIPIKRSIERVPGGMMIVPLLIGSLVATFLPSMPKFFGSFTNALFTGALPILAVFYVCMGASIDVKATPYLLRKGGTLLVAKVGTAIVAGVVLGHYLGEQPI